MAQPVTIAWYCHNNSWLNTPKLTIRKVRIYNEAQMLNSMDIARRAIEAIADAQGIDAVLLDLRGLNDMASFFVIVTAPVDRHMEALSLEVSRALFAMGAKKHHQEGDSSSGWVLIDFGDVVVHVFSPKEREYYGLEEVWSEGKVVVRMQ